MTEKQAGFILCLVLAGVSLAYANHFQNAFHFDDAHTILDNPYIRSLKNIPLFFTDAQTFSTLPTNQSYRPLISTSLALDYWMGSGINSFSFHLSTFFWFLLQLGLSYLLFHRLCDLALPEAPNRLIALMATAVYGLHPAIAETVNYIIQRGDIYSTLAVVASLLIYVSAPRQRSRGFYLIPFAAALLSKPPALVFPALLFAYNLLFEEGRPARAALRCLPAVLTAAALGYLISAMTPASYSTGAASASAYRLTQPLVTWRYFRTFFLPTHLSADTDLSPVQRLSETAAWGGCAFVVSSLLLAVWCSRRQNWRPTAFGLWWFIIALLPTAVFPLSELENDHRMYFPFVGLSLAVCWAVGYGVVQKLPRRPAATMGVATAVFLLLGVLAWGTWQRNAVWHTGESLWYDVTLKSPRNGRGLMNYGLTQMAKGDAARALDYFERAKAYTPNYHSLEINLGIAYGTLEQDEAAEPHFLRAIELVPTEARTHHYYARWLKHEGRWRESVWQLQQAVALNPDFIEARYLLMQIFSEEEDWMQLKAAAEDTLQRFPYDTTAATYLSEVPHERDGENAVPSLLTSETHLALSYLFYQTGRYHDCITAARQALKLRPDSADAYNNIAAAYGALRMWDAAIEAARAALSLRPAFELARNNLAWAEAQKNAAATP